MPRGDDPARGQDDVRRRGRPVFGPQAVSNASAGIAKVDILVRGDSHYGATRRWRVGGEPKAANTFLVRPAPMFLMLMRAKRPTSRRATRGSGAKTSCGGFKAPPISLRRKKLGQGAALRARIEERRGWMCAMSSTRSRPAQALYETHCARGKRREFIKLHKSRSLGGGKRTSAAIQTNQFSLILHTAANGSCLQCADAVPDDSQRSTAESPRCAFADQDPARVVEGVPESVSISYGMPDRESSAHRRTVSAPQDRSHRGTPSRSEPSVETSNQSKSTRQPPRRYPPTRFTRAARKKVPPGARNSVFWCE